MSLPPRRSRSTLSQAGLVIGERQSRSIIYRADLDRFRAVALYLLKDCCGGNANLCQPLIDDLACCSPKLQPSLSQ